MLSKMHLLRLAVAFGATRTEQFSLRRPEGGRYTKEMSFAQR
jgi:hypothetical protein